MRKLAFILCVTITLIAVVPPSLLAQNTLQDEFLKNAPKAWNKYLEQFRTIFLEETLTVSYPDENGGWDTTHSGRKKLLNLPYRIGSSQQDFADPLSYRLIGSNPSYVFTLKHSQNEEQEWEIVSTTKISHKTNSKLPKFPALDKDVRHRNITDYSHFDQLILYAAVALKPNHLFWLPALLEEEEFEILSAEESFEDGVRVVKIEYRYEPENVVGVIGPSALRSGAFWLLPDNSWVMKRATFEMLDPPDRVVAYQVKAEFEYNDLKDPQPLPIKYVNTTELNGKCEYKEVTEYKWDRKPTLPNKKECFLSFYGFPEPQFEGGANWQRPLLVLIGLVLTSIAYFNWQNRKKRTNASVITEESKENN